MSKDEVYAMLNTPELTNAQRAVIEEMLLAKDMYDILSESAPHDFLRAALTGQGWEPYCQADPCELINWFLDSLDDEAEDAITALLDECCDYLSDSKALLERFNTEFPH
jgi:hypothetical protein